MLYMHVSYHYICSLCVLYVCIICLLYVYICVCIICLYLRVFICMLGENYMCYTCMCLCSPVSIAAAAYILDDIWPIFSERLFTLMLTLNLSHQLLNQNIYLVQVSMPCCMMCYEPKICCLCPVALPDRPQYIATQTASRPIKDLLCCWRERIILITHRLNNEPS